MDAIDRITTRIGQIENQIASLRPPTPSSSNAAAAPNQFTAALGAALRTDQSTLGAAIGTDALESLSGSASSYPATSTSPTSTYPTSLTLGLGSIEDYPNGRIPEQLLAPLPGTDEWMAPEPAAAFTAMYHAAAADGVDLIVTDGYRPLADQERLAAELGLYAEGGLAAVPGTSNHGVGLSVDLELDADAQAWMRANGGRFGFVEDVPREPWHWTYRGL